MPEPERHISLERLWKATLFEFPLSPHEDVHLSECEVCKSEALWCREADSVEIAARLMETEEGFSN